MAAPCIRATAPSLQPQDAILMGEWSSGVLWPSPYWNSFSFFVIIIIILEGQIPILRLYHCKCCKADRGVISSQHAMIMIIASLLLARWSCQRSPRTWALVAACRDWQRQMLCNNTLLICSQLKWLEKALLERDRWTNTFRLRGRWLFRLIPPSCHKTALVYRRKRRKDDY